ncbi:MAG TPA: CHAD domain-containing protein [Gemmatimonadaceae bacterium]|nr:CHAD domain-containing protein [Gemmatimonadaceae bacterium]
MPPRITSLRESTHRVVRLVALEHLADATAARERLAKGSDDEALHDFRVALRRLRSWERAFRPYIRDDVGKKLRRRLGNLAQDTGASRDLEVHLAWLRDQRRSVGRRQRAGVAWLLETLTEQKESADAVLESDVDDRFNRLRDRLERRLSSYRERLQVRADGHASPPAPFASALAPRVRDAGAVLHAQLEAIRSLRDDDQCHDARIAAKRLRYLLEPIGRLVPGADELVTQLKGLQDVLGDLHDAQVFGSEIEELAASVIPPETPNVERRAAPPDDDGGSVALEAGGPDAPAAVAAIPAAATLLGAPPPPNAPGPPERRKPDPRPGIAAIAERLRERANTAFVAFSNEWLGERSAPFFQELEAVAERILTSARAGVEIERKYLLRFVPDEARDGRRVDIAQGYIPGEELHERIRSVSVRHGTGITEERYYRTVKLGEGVARTEIEEETTAAIFEAMWPLTKGHRLRKRRFHVEDDGRMWEIDEFKNRDLVLAEVELKAEDEAVTFPSWLAPAVQREVTTEPAFLNINLAR